MREFTLEDLVRYDGREGRPAYVAYKGNVYDVTESAMWEAGDHGAGHTAGRDLTEAHEDAPHEEYILDFPQVGTVTE